MRGLWVVFAIFLNFSIQDGASENSSQRRELFFNALNLHFI
jgi:hypothetical protein